MKADIGQHAGGVAPLGLQRGQFITRSVESRHLGDQFSRIAGPALNHRAGSQEGDAAGAIRSRQPCKAGRGNAGAGVLRMVADRAVMDSMGLLDRYRRLSLGSSPVDAVGTRCEGWRAAVGQEVQVSDVPRAHSGRCLKDKP